MKPDAPSTHSRPRHWLALSGFLLLAVIFYAPLVLTLRTFPDGDFTHHFLPFSLFQQGALRAGQLPLWNPYTYSGHPFLADTQAAVFYPLSNLLLLLTLPWASVADRLYWLQIEAIVHIGLAGSFVYWLVYALTQRRLAAFAAGCAFAFSGYLTGYPPLQLAVLRTAIWLPLLLYLLLRAMDAPTRWRWWLGAALTAAVAFSAGHPQTFLHSSYAAAAWVLFLLLPRRRPVEPAPRLIHQLIGLLLFLALALGLSAAQLLPSLEFSQLSVRAQVDYAYVSSGFPRQDTWQLLLPGVLTQFSPLYVGVVGLGLALIGFTHGSRKAVRLFFMGLALVALLLAYGTNGFLYPLAYQYAPGWQLFRGQERAAFLVALGLSVLIGLGMAALPSLSYAARRWLALLYAMGVATGIYAFGLFWQLLGESAVGEGQYLWIAGVTMLLALAVVVLLLRPGWSQRRAGLLVGLVLLNLFWANITTNLAPFDPVRKTILAPEMEALAAAVTPGGNQTEGLPGRVYNEFRIYEDYGMRQSLEDVWGSSPLRLARYAALFDNFPLDRLWQLTGVSHVLTWRRELFAPSTLLAEFPQATDSTYLHRLTEPNPRAWLVYQLQPATDEQAVALLADHTFDLTQIGLLPPTNLPTALALPTGASTIHLEAVAPGQRRVQVTSDTGGLLILSENWMPGWQVQESRCSDSTAATTPCPTEPLAATPLALFSVQRVNLTLLGVPIPPGTVTFDLVYWPQRLQLGLWISGGTLLLLVLLGGWHWRAKRWSAAS
ncbi:MAG: hypothetical protein KF832_30230 [Caldilineaceae bacterium]|nr:hypothetical protein [Caldilineaceae bacterium]